MSTADQAVTASNSAISLWCVVLLLCTMSVTLSPCPNQWDSMFDSDVFFSADGFIDDACMAAAADGRCERTVDFDVRHFCQQVQSEVADLSALVRSQLQSVALILERLARMDAFMAQSSDVQPPGPNRWVCPVCQEPMAHRRSFKGHIKRLYEFHHSLSGLSVKQMEKHHCQLRATTKRHLNLVSRFCNLAKGPGEFPIGTKGFSKALYDQVQLLTSSDESGLPEVVPPGPGAAPQ